MAESLRESMIKLGVDRLKEWGYPAVNKANILTDPTFREFFKSILERTQEEAEDHGAQGKPIREAVKALLAELEASGNE